MLKKKIIIAHGYWGRGGAEIAAMHLLTAVISNYDVSLVTRGGWSLNELNKVAGTTITSSDINIIRLPVSFILKQTKGGDIWHALFLRYCRSIATEYDLRITASRVIGWGRPSIHFLSDVVWNDVLDEKYGNSPRQQTVPKRILSSIGEKIAGKALNQLHKEDTFIANSRWTAKIAEPYTTTKPIVIHPPITQEFELLPWEDRLNQFVSFGRISPEKRLEDAIAILDEVRKNGYDIKLTILGQFGNDDYSKKIQNIVKLKAWVNAPGPVYGEEISTTLPLYKFGINTCMREAFGISTAEMLKAGIIPFIPHQGGQYEIVDNELLSFKDKEDAIAKIIAVLESDELSLTIRDSINISTSNFSVAKFKNDVLAILENL